LVGSKRGIKGGSAMTDRQAKWIAIGIALMLLVLLILCYCSYRHRASTFAWVSECGADTVRVVVKDAQDATPQTYTQLPISGPITEIPEFNDCQRFIQGGKYASPYAIFAAYYLDQASHILKGRPGLLRLSIPFAQMTTGAVAIPVATIYSYGGDYPPLGIKPGFNCLFLYVQLNLADTLNDTSVVTPTRGPMQARMVPWGETDPDCGALRPPIQGPERRLDAGKDLVLRDVNMSAYTTAFTPRDYPSVARWDYDSAHQEHYISMSCGDTWCEVGDSGFTSSTDIAPTTTFSSSDPEIRAMAAPAAKRTTSIRGWYDQQRLASGAPGGIQPSNIQGELIPHPGLDDVNSPDNGTNSYYQTWVRVAVARVNNQYKYFKQGENVIELCQGSARNCGIPLDQRACAPNPIDTNNWWSRIWAASSPTDTTYKCVKRADHTDAIDAFNRDHQGQHLRIPGTVRWRWRENDETTWISCETGCCTVRS
jgi:hypothetical protein